MKIWLISDTHSFQDKLEIPQDCDMVIHAGDIATYPDRDINMEEVEKFIDWYAKVPIPLKLLSYGNHDLSRRRTNLPWKEILADRGITELFHDSVNINGFKIFGSPYTPTYGKAWAYNVDRGKLYKYWQDIPDDTDILITHGPPKGILDLSDNIRGLLEQTGCKALYNRVLELKPVLHVFGHIHDEPFVRNSAKLQFNETLFVNASCYVNRESRFNNGFVVDINNKQG